MFRFRRIACAAALLALTASMLLCFAACGSSEPELVTMNMPSSYSENGLKLTLKPATQSVNYCKMTWSDVAVTGLKNREVLTKIQDRINVAINALRTVTPPAYKGIDALVTPGSSPQTIDITVVVRANFGNLLSLLITKKAVYSGAFGQAQTVYDVQPINLSLLTGDDIGVADLFKTDFDASAALNKKFYEFLAINYADDETYENRDESLAGAYLCAPFTGLGDSPKFTFDDEGITFYIDYASDEFYTRPDELAHVTVNYDESLFYNLVIFDSFPDSDTYDSVLTNKHLVAFPSDISGDSESTVDGMLVKSREIYPATFASAEAADRVAKLRPSLDDITSQSTGVGGEHYYYYFYVNRVGRFMVARLAEETYAGMNSSQSDKYYVFDALTGQNLSVSSLFVSGYDYTTAIASLLSSNDAFNTKYSATEAEIKQLLLRAQFLPRLDGFILRANGVKLKTADGKDTSEFYFRIAYSDIGYKNLLIYE